MDLASMTYAPMAWLNDFWLLRDGLVPLNASTGTVTLRLSLYSQRSWQHMMLAQLQESFRLQQSWGAMNEGEPDDLKRILTEGNPYFLALTMCVSLAHSVLDVLAFKADVGFWKGKQDVKGLSVRTIAFNAACQAIILLYLFDNDTSMVVLGSAVMGLAVECWKLTQAMDVSVVRGPPPPLGPGATPAARALHALASVLPARLVLKDKASYSESDTDRFDKEATKYVGFALIPCVLGYSVYSLKTQTHRSFYSWAVASLVGAVYAFGFVLMCPQLWINYRLKVRRMERVTRVQSGSGRAARVWFSSALSLHSSLSLSLSLPVSSRPSLPPSLSPSLPLSHSPSPICPGASWPTSSWARSWTTCSRSSSRCPPCTAW